MRLGIVKERMFKPNCMALSVVFPDGKKICCSGLLEMGSMGFYGYRRSPRLERPS